MDVVEEEREVLEGGDTILEEEREGQGRAR